MKNKMKLLMKNKMIQNGIWLFVLQGFNSLMPFITIPYITRILSASYFGDFSLGLNWVGYFQIIVEYGFVLSGTKKLAIESQEKDLKKQNELYSRVIFSRMLLCLLCALILCILLVCLKVNIRVKICMILLFSMVVGVVFQHNWFFQGKEDMKYITLGNVLGRTISTILIFIFVKKADDLYLYCILYSLNFLLMAFFGYALAKYKYETKIIPCRFLDIFSELKDGWYVFTSSAMTKLFSGFGVTYLGFFSSTYLIGIYSAIYKIPYLVIILWAPVSTAIYPYISKQFATSWECGINEIKKYSKKIVGGYVVMGAIIIVLNRSIVEILFGEEYVEYSYILIPLMLWVIIGIINNLLGIQTLVASNHEKEYSKCFNVSIIVSLLLTIVLGYKYTILGISMAMMISELVLLILILISLRRIDEV